jgi:GTP cyclohydrolase II
MRAVRSGLEIGVGAQILRDLGVERIRIIAGREVDYVGVAGFGLTLEDGAARRLSSFSASVFRRASSRER